MAPVSTAGQSLLENQPAKAVASGVLRFLALFALFVFCGQLVLPVVHRALVRHQLCAEHGEWVDVHEAAPAVQTHLQRGHGLGYVPGEIDHEHSHCDACVGTHHQFSIVAAEPRLALVPAGQAAAEQVLPGVFSPSGAGRYHVAPKQGPPLRT